MRWKKIPFIPQMSKLSVFYKHVYLFKPENLWAGAHILEPRSVSFFHISTPQMQIMVPVRTFCSQQHTYDSIPRGNSWLMATVALNVFLLSLHTSSLPRCGALQQEEQLGSLAENSSLSINTHQSSTYLTLSTEILLC